jgi:NTP pyrophosphatase (non-canonical NTP hydrolase)
MSTLTDLQIQHRIWAKKNFPKTKDPSDILLGVTEEVGELCHAELKLKQGIRGDASKHREDAIDAIGDIIIYLAHYCNLKEIDFDHTVWNTWLKVRNRDWKKNPLDGGVQPPSKL